MNGLEREVGEQPARLAAAASDDQPYPFDDRRYQRELRSARRLARELRLWGSDPDKARQYAAKRLADELVESIAEALEMPLVMIRRLLTAPSASISDRYERSERWLLPTYGWVNADTGKAHMAVAWVANRTGRVWFDDEPRLVFETDCHRTLIAAQSGGEYDRCSSCHDDGGATLARALEEVPQIRRFGRRWSVTS